MSLELPEEVARALGPRAADHAFHVYTRALHPELVPLARARVVEGPTWRARVGLLRDTGHLVELTVQGTRGREEARALVEVVAPIALDLPPGGRVELRRVGGSTTGAVDDDSGVGYVASWSYEQLDVMEFVALHARILEGRGKGERLVINRGHPENDGPAPFSMLDLVLDAEASRVETFVVHAFPADRAFLFMQSAFSPRP